MPIKTPVDPANGDAGNLTDQSVANAGQPGKLASALAVAKRIIGNDPAKPNTVLMPKSLAELHTSPTEMIPAGTLLTPEVLEAAHLDDAAVDALLRKGHAVMVEVYAAALTEPASA